MYTKKNFATFLLACVFVLPLIANTTVATTPDATNDFGEVEIREYEGQDLSSIVDSFRENSIKGPQYIDNENYTLTITGLVNNKLCYNYDDVVKGHQSSKKVVTLYCVEGWKSSILWEGVLIKDLIENAQVSPEANTVIFYAYDGYSTSLSLAYIIENNIMIAHKMNNVTLPPERGYPLQLVAESKWGYKWIKWITTIELSNNENYQGYWERRGYSNTADLEDTFYADYGGNYGDFVDLGDAIPEFPTETILPIVMVVTLVATVFRKKLFKGFS